MKIAVIDPSLFTLPYDKALVEALREEGHDATLYTKFLSGNEAGNGLPYVCELFYPGFQTDYIKSLPKGLFLGLKGIAHLFGLITLLVVLFLRRPDIIHFQWAPLPVIDRFFVPLFRKIAPVIMTVHDSSPFNNNPKSRLQGMGAIRIMKDYDHLIVHTNKARDAVIAYGINADRISRIDHGVLGGTLPAGTVPREKAQGGPLTILLFGHLKPYKGADILIRALGDMDTALRQQVRLHIAGKPQMETEPLFALAREKDVQDLIKWDLRFLDEDEVGPIFANSDITAMPYREIDASGVLMLALSIGRPIVASRIGLFAEILEDGTHGYLIPMEDHAALAVALEKLVRDPALRTQMGENVRRLGESVPSWREIAGHTAALYTAVRHRFD